MSMTMPNRRERAGTRSQENLSPGQVKGAVLRAHLQWVEHYHGPAALNRILDSLDPAIAAGIRMAVATTWCPFGWIVALDRAIEERYSRGMDLQRELGRYSAFLNLTTSYRLFQRPDFHDFLSRSTVLYRMFQDFGRLYYQKTGPTSALMTHHASSCFSPLFCASAVGYYEQVAVMHGAVEPQVEERKCRCREDEDCIFEISWIQPVEERAAGG